MHKEPSGWAVFGMAVGVAIVALLMWAALLRAAFGSAVPAWHDDDDDDQPPVACATTTTVPGSHPTTTVPSDTPVCSLTVQDIRLLLYRFRLVGPCRTRHGREHCKPTYFKLIDP